MNILRLLTGGPAESRGPILVFALLSSVGNAGLVALVNRAAEDSLLGAAPEPHLLGAYVLTLVFFLVANRASLQLANGFVQSRIEATRRRVVNKIRKVDLRTLERLGQGDVYVTVLQETDHLAQTMPLLIGAAQSALLVIFILFYVATLSLVSFAFVTVFIALAMLFFVLKQRALMAALADVHHGEADVLDSLDHFTRGFQEIRLNADKNEALFKHFSEVAYRLKYVVTSLGGRWVSLLQFSNAFIFLLVGSVVFVLPLFFEGYTDTIYKITAASVFILGPVAAIISVVRLIGRAEAGLGHVFALEGKLDAGAAARVPIERRAPGRFRGFETMALERVTFGYRDAADNVTFRIGPIDLTVRRGEILFLTGGNGSGKSTALKLLCGLYRPDEGRVACDGVAVEPETLQDYRELFSAIFTDFHLFDRLYGLGEIDPAEVERLIERMELTGIVGFSDGRFTTNDLSTGQRKRLALIVSLLEDREVYILDEWAADQDRHFREVFYRQILPDLKARGKTVVAVTHDDHYWDACDRRLTLDLGAIQRVER